MYESYALESDTETEERAVEAAAFFERTINIDEVEDDKELEEKGIDQPEVVQDPHGLFYYDVSSQINHDVTTYLISEDVIVNESPPRHAPLIHGTGRFLYVVAAQSKGDIITAKSDYSGSWNQRRKGQKTIVEHSEQFPVRVEENSYVKCTESDTHLRVCKGVKPSLPRLRRLITYDVDARKEPKGRVCIEYVYETEGDLLSIVNEKRVDEREKKQIREELLTKPTKNISANHPLVSTQQITNIARSVPERPKVNVGPIKETNWNDVKSRLSKGNFLKKEITKHDMEMYIAYDIDLLRMFLKDLPSKTALDESRKVDIGLLNLDKDGRTKGINEQFAGRGSRSGLCTIDITFARGGYYCGKLFSFNRKFLHKNDRQVAHLPVAYFFAKRHSKKEITEFGCALAEAAKDMGFEEARVRSVCRDGEEGLNAILENKLFEDAVAVRCEIHIRKNCTDSFGDVNGNKIATRLLGHCGNGVRKEGIIDCCSIGSAKRALESWQGIIPDSWMEWLNSHLDSIYGSNGLRNRLWAGYGSMSISNNPLESSNSWDANRSRKNLSLDQYLDVMEESCSATVRHCAQAPFGGGNLVVSDVPLIYRSIWETYSLDAKETLLARYGIIVRRKKDLPSVRLPEILSTGRTKLEFEKTLKNASNLEPAISTQFDGFICYDREKDEMDVLRRINGILTCRATGCRRSVSHTVCTHLLSVFLHDDYGKKEANKFAEYLINMNTSRFRKAVSSSVDGLKTKYRRWGNMESERNPTKMIVDSIAAPFETDSSPSVQSGGISGLRSALTTSLISSEVIREMDDSFTEMSSEPTSSHLTSYIGDMNVDVTAQSGDDNLDLTLDVDQPSGSMVQQLTIAGRKFNQQKREKNEENLEEWKRGIDLGDSIDDGQIVKKKKMNDHVSPLPILTLKRTALLPLNTPPEKSTVNDDKNQSIYSSVQSALPVSQSHNLDDFINPKIIPRFTFLYHNTNPFVIGYIIEKVDGTVVSRKTCVSCKGSLPLKDGLVIFHSERVRCRVKDSSIIRTLIGILHASRRCLRSRYPYSRAAMLTVTKQVAEKHTQEDMKFVSDEFGCDLEQIPIALKFDS